MEANKDCDILYTLPVVFLRVSRCAPMMWLYALVALVTLHSASPIKQQPCDNVFYAEGCHSNEISFKRVTHNSNPNHQFSVYLQGENSERQVLHALLVFADGESEFHNTLLFNPRRFERYSTLVRESEFRFNNEVLLTSRGKRLLLQYDVADDAQTWIYFDAATTGVEYDAALLLDVSSSMWHEYNTVTTERSQLLLRYQDTAVSPVDDSAQDFAGLYRLQCNQTHSQKHCLVQSPARYSHQQQQQHSADGADGLWINDVFYSEYRLVLDPTAAINRLPYELYMRWRYHDERTLRIGFHATQLGLFLNTQFQYEAQPDEESRDVLIGVDAVRYFQRTEHRLYSGQFMLYYSAQYASSSASSSDNVGLALLFIVLIGALMYCITRWFTSANYSVLHFMLTTPRRKRRTFAFQFRQVACELTAVVIGLVLWLLMLIYTEPISQAHFTYAHSAFQQRKLLLYLFSLYHLCLAVFLLLYSSSVTRKMFVHYYQAYRYNMVSEPWDKDYERVRHLATKQTTKVPTGVVLARNLVLHTVLACDLLFIFNYKAEAKPLYICFFVLVALTMYYYYVKYLFLCTYYLYDVTSNANRPVWPHQAPLLLFVLASSVVFALFAAFSVPTVYMDFLHDLNSTYPEALLVMFSIFLLASVACLGLLSVSMVVEAALPEKERKRV